jgi:hypothetical protein
VKEEKAKEWVEALRSGKYLQTTNKLKRNQGFCCLGVLCDISKDNDGMWDDTNYYLGMGHILPQVVRDEFGIYSSQGYRHDNKTILIGDKEYNNLMKANDSGVPFEDIATYIENNWEYL